MGDRSEVNYTRARTSSNPASSSTSPLRPSVEAASPATTSTTPRPTADQLKMIIMRVQAALFSRGYDPGAIDGVLSDRTKAELKKFQAVHGLSATGSMTTETLTALGVGLL